MPSFSHDGTVRLFRNRPALAVELARICGVDLPEFTELLIVSEDHTDIVPVEYRADVVVLLRNGVPVFVIVVEVQLSRAPDKMYSWPVYAATARAHHRCPALLLVVTPDPAVARWASTRQNMGGGETWAPVVVGPDGVPIIVDREKAVRDPELAVLSAVAHGGGSVETAVKIALAADAACATLPEEAALIYSDLVMASLSEAARTAFEEFMANTQGYEYQSDFARKHRAAGREEGREKALRGMLARLLEARFGSVAPDVQARIDAASVEDLDRWIEQFATASTLGEVFAD